MLLILAAVSFYLICLFVIALVVYYGSSTIRKLKQIIKAQFIYPDSWYIGRQDCPDFGLLCFGSSLFAVRFLSYTSLSFLRCRDDVSGKVVFPSCVGLWVSGSWDTGSRPARSSTQ